MKITPYDIVADILTEWCYKNYFTDMIIQLKLDGITENIIVTWEDTDCVFEYDWWEGQRDIELVGFMDIHDVKVPENVKRVIKWE